jgi:hypothetical protein
MDRLAVTVRQVTVNQHRLKIGELRFDPVIGVTKIERDAR